MFIYKTTNINNGKIYIGQSNKPMEVQYFGSGPIILKALRKYGNSGFTREILEVCDDKMVANEREKYFISYYSANTRDIGYNVSVGGNGGNLGEIVNKKISESVRQGGWLIGNQHLKGKVPHNKGVPMSEEQKQKRRVPKSEAHKKAYSEARMGVCYTPILCINNNKTYSGTAAAARELGLNAPNVIAVLKGRAKSTKGYTFIYV